MDTHAAKWDAVVKYLEQREGATPQDASCIKMVQSLLRQGMDINTTDEHGQTLLHKCGNFRELAYILLLNGADVNLQDENGDALIYTVCVPEQYHSWIGETFSAKVTDLAETEVDGELSPCMFVMVNTDDTSEETVLKIKDLGVQCLCVTRKQLQYCSTHPYWIMYGDESSREAYGETLSCANAVLRLKGLRCVREKYLFTETPFADGEPEENVYGQTSLWENREGNYFMVTISLYSDKEQRSDDIRVEGFHDDVFVTEGIIPMELPVDDMKKELLRLVDETE